MPGPTCWLLLAAVALQEVHRVNRDVVATNVVVVVHEVLLGLMMCAGSAGDDHAPRSTLARVVEYRSRAAGEDMPRKPLPSRGSDASLLS
jgi:hypothetical protein